jgi:hypothetical protein
MQTQLRHFHMATCVRRLFEGVLVLYCGQVMPSQVVGQECNFTITLPAAFVVAKDIAVSEPICAFRDFESTPTPFVNTITRISWAGLESLRVNNEPVRDIGFFHLTEKGIFSYQGRVSYSDPRSGYAQRIIKRNSRLRQLTSGQATKLNTTDVKVRWLKPSKGAIQEESVNTFYCLDAAKSNDTGVVVFNWCLTKSQKNRETLERAVMTLQINLN